MGRYAIPDNANLDGFLYLISREIRTPDSVELLGIAEGPPRFVIYNIDLTTNEQTIYNSITNIINLATSDYPASSTIFRGLPDWATWTSSVVETNITNSIFNGQTAATVKANIASTLTDITTANVSQINIRLAAIRALLGNAVDAIIAVRTILVGMGKAIVYLRNLILGLKTR